jgi:hypothetical protein
LLRAANGGKYANPWGYAQEYRRVHRIVFAGSSGDPQKDKVDDKAGCAGELTSAEELDGSDPIVEAKLTNGVLRITSKDQESEDTMQYAMKLSGADQAELRMLVPPDVSDVPRPKPFRLERAKEGR